MSRNSIFPLAIISAVSASVILYFMYTRRNDELSTSDCSSVDLSGNAYSEMIGNTPIIELKKISQLLQCKILVKMECNNPGGTGKDRAAKFMLRKAMKDPRYKRGCNVVEGTSGSTGIALASLCRAEGLNLHIVMPDDQASEKKLLLESFGAQVKMVPTCAISNRDHYVNSARKLAEDLDGIFFDQFENLANFEAHYTETGPEIWNQTNGTIDAFVMSAGTGGTIAGVSQYLKEQKGNLVRIVLADPQGSSLMRKVVHGVCFTPEQKERRIKKHRYDSIVEGVGLDRITANFDRAKIDSAVTVADQELVLMAHWLLQNEGIFVGSSTALNIAAACQVARSLGPGHTIVTIACDQGQRHASRFWNKEYISSYNLVWPATGSLPACLIESDSVFSSPISPSENKENELYDPNFDISPSCAFTSVEDGVNEITGSTHMTEEDDGMDEYAAYAVQNDSITSSLPISAIEIATAPTLSSDALAPVPLNSMETPKKQITRPSSRTTPMLITATHDAGFDDEIDMMLPLNMTPGVESSKIQETKENMLGKKEMKRLKRMGGLSAAAPTFQATV